MNRNMLWLVLILAFVLLLTACGSDTDQKSITADDVISAFVNAGLEVENPKIKTDHGSSLSYCEITTFQLPSQGGGEGGNNIYICNNQREVDNWAKYFDKLSEGGTKFSIWIFKKGDVMVQLSGAVDEEIARQYEQAIP